MMSDQAPAVKPDREHLQCNRPCATKLQCFYSSPALTIARDLSRYKGAEARIREGKDQLGLALQAAKLGVWRWDVGKGEKDLLWDEACKAMFGLPSDAAVTYETWAAAIHPDDRTHVEAGVARANDPADPIDDYVCEYRVQHSDGTVHWIAANGRAFFEPDRLSLRTLPLTMGEGQGFRVKGESEARMWPRAPFDFLPLGVFIIARFIRFLFWPVPKWVCPR
jgi:PAS domain-containing protein